VDKLLPLILRCSRVRILEETHFKLGTEQPRDSSIDDRDFKLARLDKLGDLLEVAV
jgi:hypothetical protein